MTVRTNLMAVSFASCLLWASQAGAVGLGAYVSAAAGDADEGTATHVGGGITLDTAVGRDRLFRYRLQLGYEHAELRPESGNDASLDGVITDHYFGFQIVRGEAATLWFGPEVRLGWYAGEDEAGAAFGIGAAAGLDLPLSPTVTLSLSGGYRDVLQVYVMDDLNERLWHLDLSLLWGRGAR